MTESRVAPRRPASLVPSITAVRLTPVGGNAALVNISATGVLVECSTRIAPGSPVTVVFEGTFVPASVSSKVARCEVTGIDQQGMLRYHLGIAFAKGIELEDLPSQVQALHASQAAGEHEMEIPLGALAATAPAAELRNRW